MITKILNSNAIYLKYNCVTSPSNFYKDLSYNEALSQYSEYTNAKGGTGKVQTSIYFLYNYGGKLYDIHFCFNENLSLFRVENLSYSVLFYRVHKMSSY